MFGRPHLGTLVVDDPDDGGALMRGQPGRKHRSRFATPARLVLVASVASSTVGGAVLPAAAQGAGGPERFAFEDGFDSGAEAPDPFWVEQCGVEVRQTSTLSVRQTVFADGRSVLHIAETSEWTDFDTGELLLWQRDREVLTDTVVSETVDQQAGSRTVVLDVDYRGLPFTLHAPGEGVVVLDAGRIVRTVTLVFDLQTGELVSEGVELEQVAGQWSFLGLLVAGAGPGFEELVAVVCDQLD
jgi:hypothetical protein